jgi:hypothetical protein
MHKILLLRIGCQQHVIALQKRDVQQIGPVSWLGLLPILLNVMLLYYRRFATNAFKTSTLPG